MRTNVPLLPISVEVRWRRLPPFRVSLRELMIGVVIAGLFFALVAHLGRMNRAMQYHSEQAALAAQARKPIEAWHLAMASHHRAAFERIDFPAFLAFMTFASLAAVAALGRALDWSSRRLGMTTNDEPTDSQPTSLGSPNPQPEEPRP